MTCRAFLWLFLAKLFAETAFANVGASSQSESPLVNREIEAFRKLPAVKVAGEVGGGFSKVGNGITSAVPKFWQSSISGTLGGHFSRVRDHFTAANQESNEQAAFADGAATGREDADEADDGG